MKYNADNIFNIFFYRLDFDYLSLKPLSRSLHWSCISAMFVVFKHFLCNFCSSNRILRCGNISVHRSVHRISTRSSIFGKHTMRIYLGRLGSELGRSTWQTKPSLSMNSCVRIWESGLTLSCDFSWRRMPTRSRFSYCWPRTRLIFPRSASSGI